MLQLLGPKSASWDAPSWATTSELVDYGSVEHRSCIGEVSPDAPESPLVVDVVQRDELDVDAEPMSITRSQAQVRVAGISLRGDQARDLARLLDSAADLVEDRRTTAE
jgi:hypothetical protein